MVEPGLPDGVTGASGKNDGPTREPHGSSWVSRATAELMHVPEDYI